jgi:predicted transposase YdaD
MWESSFYRLIFAEGRAQEKRSIAISLLKQDLTIDTIAKATGLSIETIQALKKEQEG